MATDPYQWARDYFSISSQRAAQDDSDTQQSLMQMFTAEANRQAPFSSYPVDTALINDRLKANMTLADLQGQYQLGATELRQAGLAERQRILANSKLDAKNAKLAATPPAAIMDWTIKDAEALGEADPAAILTTFDVESGFDAGAVSPTGATGLGQFTSGTAKRYNVNPRDPRSSIAGTIKYKKDIANFLISNGIAATPDKVHAGYVLGEGSVVRLMKNPNARAGSVINPQILSVNNINPNVSSLQALTQVSAKFMARYPTYKKIIEDRKKKGPTLITATDLATALQTPAAAEPEDQIIPDPDDEQPLGVTVNGEDM